MPRNPPIYETLGQSLLLEPASTTPTITTAKLSLTGPLSNDPAFTELYIRPAAISASSPDTCINVDGSCIGFFQSGALGEIYVLDADPNDPSQSEWLPTGERFLLNSSDFSENWIRINLLQVPSSQEWDVSVEGRLKLTGIGMDVTGAPADQLLTLRGNTYGPVYVDDLTHADTNLLLGASGDTDKDGILDSWKNCTSAPAT